MYPTGRYELEYNEIRMRYLPLLACIWAYTLAAQSNAGAGSIEGHV